MDFSQPDWLDNWPALEHATPNDANTLFTDWTEVIPVDPPFAVAASSVRLNEVAQLCISNQSCDRHSMQVLPPPPRQGFEGFLSLPPYLQLVSSSMPTPLVPLYDGPPTSNKFPQALSETVQRNLHSVGHSSRCAWPKCSSTDSFMGLEAIEDHIVKIHVSAVQAAWPGCKWPDCESRKGAFSTASRLWDHIQNIHIEPLICPERDCSHKKAFGKQGDLDRHRKSKHCNGSLPFKCTRPMCSKPINGFARRDKLKEHLRNWHGAFECVIQGCHRGSGNGFRTQEQLDSHGQTGHRELERGCPLSHCQTSNTFEASLDVLLADHIAAIHGDYNCELGTCGKNPASKFIPYTLKKHLIADHDVLPSEAVGLVDSLINAGECALKGAQLARLGWTLSTRDIQGSGSSKTFVDCKSCSSIDSEQFDSGEREM